MKKPLIIFGTGSGADVYMHCAMKAGLKIVAFGCSDECFSDLYGTDQIPIVRQSYLIKNLYKQCYQAIVSISDYRSNLATREQKYNELKEFGYDIATLNFSDAVCGEGSLVEQSAVLAPFVEIGRNTHIAPSVSLAHHTKVGSHCHIAIGASVGGCVEIGDRVFIGVGAIVSDHVKIGSRCHISPGMVVMKDVPDGTAILRERREPITMPIDKLVEILRRKESRNGI